MCKQRPGDENKLNAGSPIEGGKTQVDIFLYSFIVCNTKDYKYWQENPKKETCSLTKGLLKTHNNNKTKNKEEVAIM